MRDANLLVASVIVLALVFDFINGFHDSANAIATAVSTRVLTPRVAIVMAGLLNFVGALVSTKVARTIAGGMITQASASQSVILAAILGAIAWNLITWRYGIPSSSSHALIGGLCGAALIRSGRGAVLWSGVFDKVVLPLVASPVVGFLIGLALMAAITVSLWRSHPGRIDSWFRRIQILSAAAMAFSHGSNDAQKSMGAITLALVSGGLLTGVSSASAPIPVWVILVCAVAMGLGTAAGGWRIIHTMGHRIIRLKPVHGFAAETAASITILAAGHYGMPVSTTHVISGSIFGVGASRRLSAVRWGVAQSMVVAWILTLPASALIAAIAYSLVRLAV